MPERYSKALLGESKRPWQGGPDAPAPEPAAPQTITPEGSPAAYMGPDQGPFRCDNCSFYHDPNNCTKPEVLAEVGDPDKDGFADVDPGGCCNFFSTMGA